VFRPDGELELLPRRLPARCGITLIELLVVMAIISLIMGVSYPSVSRGLESVRLRMAGDDVSSFLSLAMNRVERTESPVEVRFLRSQRALEMGGPNTPRKTLQLPDGINIGAILPSIAEDPQGDRNFLLMPGAAFPRLLIELTSQNGGRRAVRIDPATGTPVVEEAAHPFPEAPLTQPGAIKTEPEATKTEPEATKK
jgi:prepilin-type N-terminal cleavage/methylation domain-containing protein